MSICPTEEKNVPDLDLQVHIDRKAKAQNLGGGLLVELILQPCYEVSLENFLSLLVIAI